MVREIQLCSFIDQRGNQDVSISFLDYKTRKRGGYDFYEFNKDLDGYDKEFENLKRDLIEGSKFIFNKYSSLENFYEADIVPILEKETKLQDTGANWIFRYLRLCRLTHPERYDELKKILIDQIEFMHSRKEPNIEHYYDRLDEIFAYLESLKD